MPQCSQPWCGGCYEVEPGIWIHPPKSGYAPEREKLTPLGEEFLERWVRNQNEALDKQGPVIGGAFEEAGSST